MAPADQKKLKKTAIANLKANAKGSGPSSMATPVEDQSKVRKPQSKYGLRVIHQPKGDEGVIFSYFIISTMYNDIPKLTIVLADYCFNNM